MVSLLFVLVALAMLLAPATARKPAPDDAVAESFLWYLHNMERTVAESRTIRWVLHRRDGATEGWDELHNQWREGAQHARWKAPYAGREALWLGDKVHVLPEPGLPLLEVEEGSAILGGPFLEHGEPGLITRLAQDAARVVADPDYPTHVVDLGGKEVRGEAARCFRVTWPEGYPDHPRSEPCVNLRTNLVARHASSSWELEFSDIRVDATLDDALFELSSLTSEQ